MANQLNHTDSLASGVFNRFAELAHSLVALAECLRSQSQYTAWLPLTEQEQQETGDTRAWALRLFTSIFYQDQQSGRNTISRYGLVATNAQGLALAEQVNSAKDQFKQAVTRFRQAQPGQLTNLSQQLVKRHPELAALLRADDLGRLHLKQAYRHIPLLNAPVIKVGFSWYLGGRSVKKISLAQAEQQLRNLGEDKPHIQLQLQKLQQLAPSEHHRLRKVQRQTPLIRANIVFQQQDPITKQLITCRKSMNVALPLLFPLAAGKSLPEHSVIPLIPPEDHQRLKRSDKRISEQALLPSIRVYSC